MRLLIRKKSHMSNQNTSTYRWFTGTSLFLLLVVISTYSCKKYESKDIVLDGYDAEYAIPLINTSATLQDLLEKFDSTTFIQFDDDGLITLNYKGSVKAKTSGEIFNVLGNYDLIPIPLQDTNTFIPYNAVNGVDLDYAILKEGLLKWGFGSEHLEPVEVTVTMPTMTKNGIPFSETRTVGAYSGSGNPVIGGNLLPGVDVSEYRLEAIDNIINIEYVSVGQNTGNRDTLQSCFVVLEGLVASYVEGYLGNDLYDFERDTILIDFFENWTRGDVYFTDPRLTLNIENSFGIPVRSQADVVNVITALGELLPLESDYLDEIDIAYPALDEVGIIKYTSFDFTKENSNIDVLLGSNPVAVDYDVDAVPNPDSLTSIRGFMTDSSYFKVQMEVDIPIHGLATGFEARDTFAINLSNSSDVIYAEFKVVTENEIALDVTMQLYFADMLGVILDSMFIEDPVIMGAAPVDGDGNPTGATEKITFSKFDEERFEGIRGATKLLMNAKFSTTNNGTQSVKVYRDNEVRIRAGMKLGIRD
ncbi:MAG: hypothetical protein ACI9VN_000161 [Patescibacteria group bacterium]|jgi:hypothetical protein